jgi:hypothetical protein
MARIEVGLGQVWKFTATENITSGSVVFLSGSEKVAICHYSSAAIGVSLTPASTGKPISIILGGIADVDTTGVGNTAFNTWMQASGGKACASIFVSGAAGYAGSARNGGHRTLCLGLAIEDITRNTVGKILLTI